MKTAAAILVFAALIAAPIACTIVVCPELEAHHCCPKPKSLNACPFDILSSAKGALPAIVSVNQDLMAFPVASRASVAVFSPIYSDRDLHLENRVLRI
jgi:hypothetical protein